MAAHLPTIYNAREFVEAGGVMSYGPNASDLFRRSADGREGGGQQAVSSLNESISFRARNAYSNTPLIPAKTGTPSKDLGPCKGVPATRASRGAPPGTRREGRFLPRPGDQNTHSSVVIHWAAGPPRSKSNGPRAPRPGNKDAGIDRDHPPRDFATGRRDRIGTDYGHIERRGFCRVPNHPTALQGRQRLFEFAGAWRSLGANRPPHVDPFPLDPWPPSARACCRKFWRAIRACRC